MEEKKPEENVFNLEKSKSEPAVVSKKGKYLKKFLIFILFLILLVVIFFAGFILGKTSFLNNLNQPNQPTSRNFPTFVSLSGSFNGKVTRIEGNKAWIKTEEGEEAIFAILDGLEISEWRNGKITKIGDSKDKVRIGENGSITITSKGTGFMISSITYIVGQPQVNPIPEATKASSLKP